MSEEARRPHLDDRDSPPAAQTKEVILVADDEEDIIRFVEFNLRLEGFEVLTAADGEEALEKALDQMPDLILLDIMMPKMDGYEVCERLRVDPRTKYMSVIMLTAKSLSADRVVGLTTGADDYIIKPFDPIELIARVHSTLRRASAMRALNPLTHLAGNVQVQEELARRVGNQAAFALMYVDLDNFKAFNDYYGFLRGDEAIKLLARCLSESVRTIAGNGGFVGHVGGDDFVAIVEPQYVEKVSEAVIESWDREILDLYDPQDTERGYIVVADRREKLNYFPLMTVTIGIATNVHRPITSHWEASEIASEMKHFAKRETRSCYAIDRRKPDEPGRPDASVKPGPREKAAGVVGEPSSPPTASTS